MNHAIGLALKGFGCVAPNPMVGCVIVYNHKIISEGYHEFFGGPHAEPNAIHKVDDLILKQSTLYVTLEPCSHYGKTPPCADLIISKGIKKVVVGNLDSNPLVAGKGIRKLKDAGIEVEHGILDSECKLLNKRFFTFHEKKRPYIILKWAQTQDGFISKIPIPTTQEENWITGNESKLLVHQWRSQEQAILIGYQTLIADNPLLTARLINGKNPIRLVLSKTINFSFNLNVFNTDAKTVVFNSVKNELTPHVEFVKIDWDNKELEVMSYCFLNQISSIIIEGGTKTINDFVNKQMWDEAKIFVNPNKKFHQGICAPTMNFKTISPTIIGEDLLYTVIHS